MEKVLISVKIKRNLPSSGYNIETDLVLEDAIGIKPRQRTNDMAGDVFGLCMSGAGLRESKRTNGRSNA